mgnify:CR=1 FL=1
MKYMREMKYLKVSADIARRAGVIDVRHRTADGNFIVNESDLRMVRFEPEEYVRGISGQVLTEQEAAKLIEAGGNQIGEEILNEESNRLLAEDSLPAQDNQINGEEVQDE